jgi:hypothetical protein
MILSAAAIVEEPVTDVIASVRVMEVHDTRIFNPRVVPIRFVPGMGRSLTFAFFH